MVPRFSLSARVLVAILGLAAPSLTAAEPPRVTALKDARVVLAPGRVLEKATIVVRKGVIVAVGPNVAIPPDAVVHDLSGRTVYPGLIDAHVTLSRLSGKRDAPADDDEAPAFGPRRTTTPAAPATGNVHPSSRLRAERRAVAEVVLKDEVKEQLRGLGFTTVNAVPDRGIFRGRSAVLSLGDGSVAKNVVLAREAQVVASDLEADGEDRYPNSKMGATAVIRQTILDARWLRDARPRARVRPTKSPDASKPAALGDVVQAGNRGDGDARRPRAAVLGVAREGAGPPRALRGRRGRVPPAA
jgi:imidazolonepropionase-like amidohydrolase